MKTIVFYWMMLKGSIIPQGDNDGRKMYALKFPDDKVVDYAYKEEILNYLETGTFYYDEDINYAKHSSVEETGELTCD
jgi:hypothetical protein